MLDVARQNKPKYFDWAGWSWASLGILGLFGSALGLLAVPGVLMTKDMLLSTEGGFSSEAVSALLPMLNLWIPATLIKFVFSGLLTYVSFMFMQGKKWAYLVLMWTNYFFVVGTVVIYFYAMTVVRGMVQKLQAGGLMESVGIDWRFPSAWDPMMLMMLFLLLLPFLLFVWYFNWPPVKYYFVRRPSST